MLRLLRKKVYPIGIDLGSHSLKIIQLTGEEDELELVAAAKADVPEEIRDDPLELHNWYIAQIKELLVSRGFKGKKVVSSLPAQAMLIQHLRLPKMKPDQIQKNLTFEAQERLPFTVEGAMLRHIIAGEVYENEENKLEIILMAASRNAVQEHLHLIEHTRVEIDSVNVEACALVNSFSNLLPDDESEKAYMLIDLGHSATKVIIVHGNAIRFCRTINAGVQDIIKESSRRLSIPTQRAMAMFAEGLSSASVEATPATAGAPAASSTALETEVIDKTSVLQKVISEKVQKLGYEIRSCVRYHDTVFENHPVAKVIFVGGPAGNKSFCQQLAREIRLPAQLGNPMARIKKDNQPHPDLDEAFNGEWAVAFGLSLGKT